MARNGLPPECYATESAAYLAELIEESGREIRLETDTRHFDIYGRVLAYLWNGAGEMLNEKILREGYAVYLPESDALRWRERLRRAGEEARLSSRGLWHPDACR
jgi:micrococcal nuclease